MMLIDAFFEFHKFFEDYKLYIYGDGPLRNILENKIAIHPVVASISKPPAHKTPIAALHHKVAAVFNPLIFPPSLIITPAPKKPIQIQLEQQFVLHHHLFELVSKMMQKKMHLMKLIRLFVIQ